MSFFPRVSMTGDRLRGLALAGGVVALLLPFVGKPLHVDDPVYVWVAQQIAAEPLDFFGLTVNWYGYEQPLAEVNRNPPLVSYAMALWALFFGWTEVALHLGFLVPAIALAFGIRALGQRFTRHAELAAAVAFTTPVVLVTATTVMSDMPMLALYCWALFFWVRGIDESCPRDLAVGAGLVALCTLTKYFGVTLLPLMIAYGLARERQVGAWLLYLAIPLIAIAGYELYTASLYGQGLFLEASGYSLRRGQVEGQGSLARWILGLVYVGGCIVTALFFAPFALSRRVLLGIAALALAFGAYLHFLGSLGEVPLHTEQGTRWDLLAHASAFTAATLVLVGLLVSEFATRRDPVSLLLGLWVAGTVVFALTINWTTSGRAVLLLGPPLALLLVRQLERAPAPTVAPKRAALCLATGCAAVLALAVAGGDYALARSARRAAELLHQRYPDDSIWFQGHWGFQHYMQEMGASPVDFGASRLEPGHLLATPNTSANTRLPPISAFAPVEIIDLPLDAIVSTISRPNAAGFYSTVFGPLPYAFGRPEPEECYLFRAKYPYVFDDPSVARSAIIAGRGRPGDWQSGRFQELDLPRVRAWYAREEPERGSALLAELSAASPDSAERQRQLADTASRLGDPGTAASLYRRALELDPEHRATLNELAWILATADDPVLRDPDEAIHLAELALAGPEAPDPNFIDTLAAAYAAAGRFDEAAATAAKGALVAEAGGDPAFAAELRARSEQFRAGKRGAK